MYERRWVYSDERKERSAQKVKQEPAANTADSRDGLTSDPMSRITRRNARYKMLVRLVLTDRETLTKRNKQLRILLVASYDRQDVPRGYSIPAPYGSRLSITIANFATDSLPSTFLQIHTHTHTHTRTHARAHKSTHIDATATR